MQHVNTDNDAVDAFKVLDESGGGAISRLVVVGVLTTIRSIF